jgi:pSer/pThr/pTyr-binding forkhead associated (FHA) protein
MPRLVIHPGTPQAWEIQLKPGLNFLGRGASNDFKIEDGSVSGSHCQIIVENGATIIKDMGSTNGTYVNRAKVMESRLESGQPLRLGSVDIIFYTDGPDAVTSHVVPPPPSQTAPPPPPPLSAALKPAGSLRISGLSHAPEPAAATATDAPPPSDSMDPAAPAEIHGTRYCKFHPKAPARYLCNKCNRTFCELCVTSRNVGAKVVKTCRSCGVECVPVQFRAAAQKSFYASLAGAFGYPVKGVGILIVLCAAVAYAALTFVSLRSFFGWIITIFIYGGIFLFMQNIIHTTTSDEEEDIGFPDFGGAFGAAFQLFVTFIASFWLWIALTIAKLLNVDIPIEAIIASRIIGLIYFPMALLAVAMKDSPLAANPLIVLPAMMKAPVEYGITVLFLLVVYGISVAGDLLTSSAVPTNMMFTKDMSTLLTSMGIKAAVGVVTVYLLCVTMRILGLFYNASKQKLGWFAR